MIGLLIDDQDRHLVEGRKVWLSGGYPAIYAGDGKQERLHRLIARPPLGFGVDHINRNKLDIRRANLRVCKQADNCLNVPPRRDNKSGIRGVWFDALRNKWSAQISIRGQRYSLGRFDDKQAAVVARRAKEAELWGEYAPQ